MQSFLSVLIKSIQVKEEQEDLDQQERNKKSACIWEQDDYTLLSAFIFLLNDEKSDQNS